MEIERKSLGRFVCWGLGPDEDFGPDLGPKIIWGRGSEWVFFDPEHVPVECNWVTQQDNFDAWRAAEYERHRSQIAPLLYDRRGNPKPDGYLALRELDASIEARMDDLFRELCNYGIELAHEKARGRELAPLKAEDMKRAMIEYDRTIIRGWAARDVLREFETGAPPKAGESNSTIPDIRSSKGYHETAIIAWGVLEFTKNGTRWTFEKLENRMGKIAPENSSLRRLKDVLRDYFDYDGGFASFRSALNRWVTWYLDEPEGSQQKMFQILQGTRLELSLDDFTGKIGNIGKM